MRLWVGWLLAAGCLTSCLWEAPPQGGGHRFLVVGDTGTGTAVQSLVAQSMKKLVDAEGAEFILLLGDNFYPTGVSSVSDPLWQSRYEQMYGGWGLPVYPVLGNHDYGGNGAGTEDDLGAYQVAYSQGSATWTMPSSFYHFVRGSAVFVALDTNWIKRHPGDDRGQGAAVEDWLAQADGWKVAFGHHPYLSNGPHGNAGAWDGAPTDPLVNGLYFHQFFEAHLRETDVYFSGHDHSLQVLGPPAGSSRPLLVVSGAGGQPATALTGDNKAPFQRQTNGFVAVDFTPTTLHLRVFDTAGGVMYQTTLTR